jgi:hypothetical protein
MGEVLPVEVPPGYVKVDSPLAERGRYIDGFGVRFFRGKPQKVGGWVSMLTATLLGIVRGLKTWNDLTSQEWIAAGTTQKLYAISNASFTPQDITPFVSSLAATNPFTTTNGSNIVTVAWTGHLAVAGQIFYIPSNVTVGGMTLTAGEYTIAAIVDNNDFTITGPSNATSGATGGGTITISLEIPPGLVSPSSGFGWGAGTWGTGTWGTPRTTGSISFDPLAWSLSNFGKLLLASPSGGALYSWDPTNVGQPRAIKVAGTTPAGSPTAPPSTMSGFFTTAERFVIAYGINGNLMQFQWCGQGDFTDWDATALTGSVGSPSRIRNVTRGRKIMGGVDIGGFVSLIWTDSAVYTHQYTGSANVFNTLLAGVDCGLIGPAAYVVVGNTAYWMSSGGFFRCSGGAAPEKIPGSEDISEWFFQNLRPYYSIQSFAWYNARFGEVTFAFCSNGSTQPDTLVIYNAEHGYWFTDKLVRTASARFDGQDSRPILAGVDGQLYQHDQGVDANGSPLPWSLTSALFEIKTGQVSFGIDSFYPDMQRQTGNITITLNAYDRTPDPVLDSGTKTFGPTDDQVDFRVAGRDIAMIMSGGTTLGDDFRLGAPKISITESGGR